MSFYTITLLVRWAGTSNSELLEKLREVPLEKRPHDERLQQLVQTLRTNWASGNKIQRLGTLGWNDREVCTILSDIIEQLPNIRQEYAERVKQYGNPPEFTDENFEAFRDSINEIKNFQ